MTGPGVLIAAAVAALVVLAAVVLVDKRRPLRHLDDRPHHADDVPGPWLGDGDLNRATDERIAAEHNLHRRLR
ncbi:hypothetical protein [Amycolatopsis sp. cmx-4-83]|uniref:hypothetical protein n=1 Tax=Amycolatopsis sp. cmx-4-83 TaxID=2790940 RepID=UPI003978AE0A